MHSTLLVYMTEGQKLKDTAHIISVIPLADEKITIILDRTIFYPQGGGQPYDTGTIAGKSGQFQVNEVRFIDGVVHHTGTFTQGSFNQNDQVELIVDAQRRELHSKLHTAGHLVDLAFTKLGLNLIPSKGYHFPDSPYVEYEGTFKAVQEKLRPQIEEVVNKIIAQNLPIMIKLVSREELEKICNHIPDYLPTGKPTRVMIVQGYQGIPCGGTHVTSTGNVGYLTIPTIKSKKGNTRISYALAKN